MNIESESPRGAKRKLNDVDLPEEAPGRIRALDQDVVNKIAAGEIIVAPKHALKELIENAIDAGSTSLEILVRDGGLKLLQITDNGHGINRDDLPILCERFTTSKLKAFEDLESIGTYGFRGEALASISHIARLTIATKVKESSCAWRAHYCDGDLAPTKPGQSAEPKACAGRQGTQITVEDLFYNIPTRQRAFRSASEEYAKILDVVGRYSIHCRDVAFSCKKHGDASLGISVASSASTVDRIRQIHGSAVANELIDFEASDTCWGFKSEGWISNANYHVKRTILLLFINHRAVESTAIKKALEQTYSTFLPKGGHPFVYLSLEIDPKRVDVNVHPTKREVNFLNEDEIIDGICEEIRARLGRVDTSRTFMTQTLLPGVNVSTISPNNIDSPSGASASQKTPLPGISTKTPNASMRKADSYTRPYEANMVRTDDRARKITTMFAPQQPDSPSRLESRSRQPDNDRTEPTSTSATSKTAAVAGAVDAIDTMDYEYTSRVPSPCRLGSVKELRADVRSTMHNPLTEVFSTHTFVGIVDHARRLAAIQSATKLFLVDYGLVSFEYFYQLGLTDFGNFGAIKLDPPLQLRDLLRVGADIEAERAADNGEGDDLDWEEVVQAVEEQLLNSRAMLREYFSFDLAEDGMLHTLPLLMKGYMPSIAKLPTFLVRLGPHVVWTDEKACFRTFLRELARWYVPEALPSPPPRQEPEKHIAGQVAEADKASDMTGAEGRDIVARRSELSKSVERVLFPAFKARLVATKSLLKGGAATEVANLKGLYRVFERC
ncbi:MAG: DNA mismatch repair protein [Alyxoria varia]|nr:MAG: DNA mismatch repair protein [Alyxoria varia]